MDNKKISSIFNEQVMEFINDIQLIFPNDVDINTCKNALIALKKTNPKLLIILWKNEFYLPYKDKIDEGDINFFINKDYSSDLNKTNNSNQIIKTINRLREPIKNMSIENQGKSMKYIQNLSKISMLIN